MSNIKSLQSFRILILPLALAAAASLAGAVSAHADALRCDVYYNGVQYYVTSGMVTATALEGVMVDEDYLDLDEVQTQNFGQCAIEAKASGENVAYLGVDNRGLTMQLVLPTGAPWHKGNSFTGALRVDYGTGRPMDVPAKCQIL